MTSNNQFLDFDVKWYYNNEEEVDITCFKANNEKIGDSLQEENIGYTCKTPEDVVGQGDAADRNDGIEKCTEELQNVDVAELVAAAPRQNVEDGKCTEELQISRDGDIAGVDDARQYVENGKCAEKLQFPKNGDTVEVFDAMSALKRLPSRRTSDTFNALRGQLYELRTGQFVKTDVNLAQLNANEGFRKKRATKIRIILFQTVKARSLFPNELFARHEDTELQSFRERFSACVNRDRFKERLKDILDAEINEDRSEEYARVKEKQDVQNHIDYSAEDPEHVRNNKENLDAKGSIEDRSEEYARLKKNLNASTAEEHARNIVENEATAEEYGTDEKAWCDGIEPQPLLQPGLFTHKECNIIEEVEDLPKPRTGLLSTAPESRDIDGTLKIPEFEQPIEKSVTCGIFRLIRSLFSRRKKSKK